MASKNDEIILLIDVDEVDAFFKKDFYANIYRPYAKLCSDEITAFGKEIWKEHMRGVKNVLTVAKIKKWPLYIACINIYIGWEFFIEESSKTLLGDLRIFDGPGHVYHIDSERSRIGYKDHDGYIYNVNHGYQTMFAYFKEYEKKTITTTGMDMNIYFLVDREWRNVLRRTGFVYSDEDLNTDGGVHVIQTFVSLEQLEQIQWKGHTASLENEGSCSRILPDSEVESTEIKAELIVKVEAKSESYTFIDKFHFFLL